MATLSTIHPTLLDVTKRLDPSGKIDAVAEILAETNEILDDMVWIEGNLPTGHRSTIRTGLPTPTWRKLYGGVQPTKSETAQVTDTCGMLEAYAEVDKALADLNGNTAAFRLSEERAHIQGLSHEVADTIFVGDETTEPEAFTGLHPRFNSKAATNGENIFQTDGTVAHLDRSLWLVVWGANTVHGIYPKGSKAGLSVTDKGQVTIESIDGSGGRMEAYRTHYRWDCGLCVRDWRYIVRIDYDESDVVKSGATGIDFLYQMGKALRYVPSLNAGRPVFYADRTTLDLIEWQANANGTLAFRNHEDAHGKRFSMFRGVPVKRCDAISGMAASGA